MLDEPVNGLDPEGVRWVRNLLKSLAAEGRTIFLPSHLMSEMSLTADRLIIIGRGRLITETTIDELLRGTDGATGTVHALARSTPARAYPPDLRGFGSGGMLPAGRAEWAFVAPVS